MLGRWMLVRFPREIEDFGPFCACRAASLSLLQDWNAAHYSGLAAQSGEVLLSNLGRTPISLSGFERT